MRLVVIHVDDFAVVVNAKGHLKGSDLVVNGLVVLILPEN